MICSIALMCLRGYRSNITSERTGESEQTVLDASSPGSKGRRIVLTRAKQFYILGGTRADLNQAEHLSTARFFASSGPASSKVNSSAEGKETNECIDSD
jgi:hypothetical protein